MAVNKKWCFKDSMELLTLEGDFFLFKFTIQKDYDMVFYHSSSFINGRPFIFQKYTWNFRSTKSNLSKISLWVKFPNPPLCCWNESGFSKVASKIKVPLVVDNLTTTNLELLLQRFAFRLMLPLLCLIPSISILMGKFDSIGFL